MRPEAGELQGDDVEQGREDPVAIDASQLIVISQDGIFFVGEIHLADCKNPIDMPILPALTVLSHLVHKPACVVEQPLADEMIGSVLHFNEIAILVPVPEGPGLCPGPWQAGRR